MYQPVRLRLSGKRESQTHSSSAEIILLIQGKLEAGKDRCSRAKQDGVENRKFEAAKVMKETKLLCKFEKQKKAGKRGIEKESGRLNNILFLPPVRLMCRCLKKEALSRQSRPGSIRSRMWPGLFSSMTSPREKAPPISVSDYKTLVFQDSHVGRKPGRTTAKCLETTTSLEFRRKSSFVPRTRYLPRLISLREPADRW